MRFGGKHLLGINGVFVDFYDLRRMRCVIFPRDPSFKNASSLLRDGAKGFGIH